MTNNLYHHKTKTISINAIIKVISHITEIPVSDILGNRRFAHISKIRQLAMHVVKVKTNKSLNQIGEAFNRDHTTIIHGIEKNKQAMMTDPFLAEIYRQLTKTDLLKELELDHEDFIKNKVAELFKQNLDGTPIKEKEASDD